jgi:hypothetical protein
VESTLVLSWKDKLNFHLRKMIYGGGLVKSAAQAAVAQASSTPTEWGQGWDAFGRRFASSHGTRAIRQTLQFTLDTAVPFMHQDPRYIAAPQLDTTGQIANVFKQTFFSPDDHLKNRFAAWRVGSALGSELISNAWRPDGPRWGDRSIRAALYRTAFDIGGDLIGNALREFLPQRGKLGRLLKPFR